MQKRKFRIVIDMEAASDGTVEEEKKELMSIVLNELGAYGEFDVSRIEIENIK